MGNYPSREVQNLSKCRTIKFHNKYIIINKVSTIRDVIFNKLVQIKSLLLITLVFIEILLL